jgi:hypothetical protein
MTGLRRAQDDKIQALEEPGLTHEDGTFVEGGTL